MWRHVKTLAWLKVRTLWHSLSTTQNLLATIARALFAAFILLGSMAMGLFFAFAVVTSGEEAEYWLPAILTVAAVFAYVIFLFFEVMTEAGRSELIDFRKMLYLPVSLRTVYGLNLAFSIITPSMAWFVMPVLGVAVGLFIRSGAAGFAGLAGLVLGMTMLAAWAYFVRGWIGAILEDKKRRRIFLILAPLVFVLVANMGNIIRFAGDWFDVDVSPGQLEGLLTAAAYVLPPIWPGTAMTLAGAGQWANALVFLALTAGAAALGVAVGYRGTLRYYAGRPRKAPAKKGDSGKAPKTSRGPNLLERRLPGMSDELSVLTLQGFREFSRHAVGRQILFVSLPIMLIFGAGFVLQSGVFSSGPGRVVLPGISALVVVLLAPQLLSNLFGVDGPSGMRSLILLPGERSRYLLARNLSRLPHLGGVALVMTLALAAAALFAAPEQTPSALEAAYVIATALVLLPQTYFLLCIVGNVVSMYFPYHIKSDTMRQRASGKAAGAGLAQLLLTPLFIGPAMLCASLDRLIELIGGPRLLGPSLAASAALLVVTLFAYRWSLGPLGRLLMRREQAILNDLLRGKE